MAPIQVPFSPNECHDVVSLSFKKSPKCIDPSEFLKVEWQLTSTVGSVVLLKISIERFEVVFVPIVPLAAWLHAVLASK